MGQADCPSGETCLSAVQAPANGFVASACTQYADNAHLGYCAASGPQAGDGGADAADSSAVQDSASEDVVSDAGAGGG